mmetsp:Transcript_16025/g.61076  ORF Transcript_16025/g.61076 Transcript_16025/m.61076 type:complete len:90 (+) Transcript_16025:665-934(+)
MVYDVTNQESFNSITAWLNEVNRYATEGTCKLLVGNKSDREVRGPAPPVWDPSDALNPRALLPSHKGSHRHNRSGGENGREPRHPFPGN